MYDVLADRIEPTLPPLEFSDDAAAIRNAVEVRAARLREARADAREGDIFSAPVQEGFRKRISRVLDSWPDLVASIINDSAGAAFPVVGGRFQWATATPTPALVLAVLPPLPESLQYRFVGKDLVLTSTRI